MPPYPKPVKQKKAKKKKRLTLRQQLIRRLDAVVRQIVLARDKTCICCGSTKNLQCGHLFTRSKYSVRWDELNCSAQCPGCNLRHEFDPHVYVNAFIDRFGLEAYKSLYERAERPRKWSTDQLEELACELEEKSKSLE